MTNKREKLTVTKVAAKVQSEIDELGLESYTLNTASRLAKKYSHGDKIFALAVYLKWNMPSMTGVEDEDWIDTAKTCKKILGA